MLSNKLTMLRIGALVVSAILVSGTTMAADTPDPGLVTLSSAHSVRDTIDRFDGAVRQKGWVVFTEIDHAAAAAAVGMPLRARTVVLFGNPQAGTPAMQKYPTLALDLPMRVLIWEDDQGGVFITRSTGADVTSRVFARHGVVLPPQASQSTEAVLNDFTRQAAQ